MRSRVGDVCHESSSLFELSGPLARPFLTVRQRTHITGNPGVAADCIATDEDADTFGQIARAHDRA